MRPKLASVTMDGSRRTILNQRRVDRPEYLARDIASGDLYWSESRKQQVFTNFINFKIVIINVHTCIISNNFNHPVRKISLCYVIAGFPPYIYLHVKAMYSQFNQ